MGSMAALLSSIDNVAVHLERAARLHAYRTKPDRKS